MKKTLSWALWVLLGFLVTPIGAETPSAEPALQYTLEGEDLPRYELFTQFLFSVESLCAADKTTCDGVLSDLVGPNHLAAEAQLMRALRAARDLEGPMNVTVTYDGDRVTRVASKPEDAGDIGIDPVESPEGWNRRAHALELEKAREFGRIYRELEAGLAAEGVSMDGIERFIRTHVMSGTVMVSDEPFEGESMDLYRAFEDEVGRRR